MGGIAQYPDRLGPGLTRVLDAGEPGAPLVLALHGVAARADRWTPAMPLLAKAGYRVMAIDLPGHGLASKNGSVDCSSSGMARALADFCARQSPSARVVLVGTSLGALYAASFGLARPDLVKGVVLVGALGLEQLGEEGRRRFGAAIRPATREENFAKLKRVFFDQSLVTAALVEEETRINSSPGASEAFAAYARYFADHIDEDAVGNSLAMAELPTMLVWGDHDTSVSIDIGKRAHQRIHGSRFATIHKAGHAPYYERPEVFCAEILPFLRNL